MEFEKLVPNIFYERIGEGIKFFVDVLEFNITHQELEAFQPFCVLEKNGLRINLFENKELANEHKPEFRLVTQDIGEVYRKVSTKHPGYLHPNLNVITLRPWGAKEFALKDQQVGVVIQQCKKS